MANMNKRIRRMSDMLNRYHLTTCNFNVTELKRHIPTWEGYAEEATKFFNHAATINDFIFDYCTTHGIKVAEFYATGKGQQFKKCVTSLKEIGREFERRG
jgi:uncharacterized protein YutD